MQLLAIIKENKLNPNRLLVKKPKPFEIKFILHFIHGNMAEKTMWSVSFMLKYSFQLKVTFTSLLASFIIF